MIREHNVISAAEVLSAPLTSLQPASLFLDILYFTSGGSVLPKGQGLQWESLPCCLSGMILWFHHVVCLTGSRIALPTDTSLPMNGLWTSTGAGSKFASSEYDAWFHASGLILFLNCHSSHDTTMCFAISFQRAVRSIYIPLCLESWS